MDRYNTLQQIGKGTFGTAFLVETKDDKRRYVLKKIRLARQTDRQREATLREMKLLSSLDHDHIVTYKEAWIEKGCVVCIVTQFCDGGDLLSQLQKSNGKLFPEDQILSWFVQVAMAIAYIHEHKVLHRDVKSSNIFLTKTGILQLGDFGLARVLEGTMEMAQTLVGTPNYMCPELLQDKPYDYKSDVWSMGCVMYEVTALKPAFQAFNMSGLMQKICKGALAPLPGQYSSEWKTLVRGMLQKDPDLRPTFDEMLQESFPVQLTGSNLVSQSPGLMIVISVGSSSALPTNPASAARRPSCSRT
mmetsp:Transcript_18175/g.58776  ORF Transcript_18175/g.58776 Transcript_18175/m.58776 type:complete len:303 (+) Transcript_18175:237-1145(+)